MGCREHLSDSYRNTSKTETTSIRDSNHSDASGRVRLNTTHRGNGAQKLETLGKVTKRKNSGNSGWEEGNVDTEERVGYEKTEKRKENSDIRNWILKNEPKKDEVEEHEKGSSENPIDLMEDPSQEEILKKKQDIAPIIKKEEVKRHEEGSSENPIDLVDPSQEENWENREDSAPIIKRSKEILSGRVVRTTINRQLKGVRKVDIRRGPSEEILNARLDLKRWDFQTLLDAEYVNDEIVNKYMMLVQERNEADSSLPVVCALTSFRYTMIVERGLKYALKMYKEDFMAKELILFPIHNEQISHWSLVVVEISTKTIHYLNSIVPHRIRHSAPRSIKKYMEM